MLQRYSFFVDCMPVEDSLSMPGNFLSHILDVATNHRQNFKKLMASQAAEGLIQEIKLDYARALSRQMFDLEVNLHCNC